MEEELSRFLAIDKIDTIFITHSHFDHTDNLDLYPDSEIIISKPEHAVAMGKYNDSIRNILSSNRAHIVQDEYRYGDKFLFLVIGGHTEGSSVIYFDEGEKHYVMAGDECYFLENMEKNIPNGNVYNASKNASFIKDAHDRGLIAVPCHDNKIFDNYARISENIVRII